MRVSPENQGYAWTSAGASFKGQLRGDILVIINEWSTSNKMGLGDQVSSIGSLHPRRQGGRRRGPQDTRGKSQVSQVWAEPLPVTYGHDKMGSQAWAVN